MCPVASPLTSRILYEDVIQIEHLSTHCNAVALLSPPHLNLRAPHHKVSLDVHLRHLTLFCVVRRVQPVVPLVLLRVVQLTAVRVAA